MRSDKQDCEVNTRACNVQTVLIHLTHDLTSLQRELSNSSIYCSRNRS